MVKLCKMPNQNIVFFKLAVDKISVKGGINVS